MAILHPALVALLLVAVALTSSYAFPQGKPQTGARPAAIVTPNSFVAFLRGTDGNSQTALNLDHDERSSHGEPCGSGCDIYKALTCNPNTVRCECLQPANFNNLEIEGRRINLQWNAQVGRCMAQYDTLCATEPVVFRDENNNSYLVPVDCDGDTAFTTCEFITDIGIMKVGKCVRVEDPGEPGGDIVVNGTFSMTVSVSRLDEVLKKLATFTLA